MRKLFAMLVAGALAVGMLTSAASGAGLGDARVSVGSPTGPFPQNKQNEPAVAVDANHPLVLAAGSNDEIDLGPCGTAGATAGSPCPFTAGVGVSGIYFSLDGGKAWTQPTYSGWSARTGTPQVGPIGTLPGYFEAGLVSGGDPALSFGPKPDGSGHFSWANGSRLYYANLVANFSSKPQETFRGAEAIGVSRTDDVAGAAAGAQSAWMPPVIASKQSSSTFSDKVQIWADNAASSPFFGTAYVCYAQFRSNAAHRQANAPAPLTVLSSHDGGSTWASKQLVPASTAPANKNGQSGFGLSGCTVRSDSHGNTYVFAEQFAASSTLPTHSTQVMFKSSDGGTTWTKAIPVQQVTDPCFVFDPVEGRCVFDGNAGARDDLSASPSVDIANGAPTGTDATNEIVDAWSDGAGGLNHEQTLLSTSTDGGGHWTSPAVASAPGDRTEYSAPAIAPDGTTVYLTYLNFSTPFQTTTASPRLMNGVFRSATVGAGGALGGFTTLDTGATGDARASSANSLGFEFLGDYVYAAATRTYGVGVWMDSRNAVDCPAIDTFRQSLYTSTPLPTPFPPTACPPAFGNTDIYAATTAP
jgi:hypothetical protein